MEEIPDYLSFDTSSGKRQVGKNEAVTQEREHPAQRKSNQTTIKQADKTAENADSIPGKVLIQKGQVLADISPTFNYQKDRSNE